MQWRGVFSFSHLPIKTSNQCHHCILILVIDVLSWHMALSRLFSSYRYHFKQEARSHVQLNGNPQQITPWARCVDCRSLFALLHPFVPHRDKRSMLQYWSISNQTYQIRPNVFARGSEEVYFSFRSLREAFPHAVDEHEGERGKTTSSTNAG